MSAKAILNELALDLTRRAAACCDRKLRAATREDAHRLMGQEAAYLHAAEMAREAMERAE